MKLSSSTLGECSSPVSYTHLYNTGITATAGIGTNLYLAKIAMDIVAKKATPDKDGMRIAELDEMKYRELLWTHRPLKMCIRDRSSCFCSSPRPAMVR